MPELPEVETTRRGIEPHISGQTIANVTIRDRRLRWPISKDLEQKLTGQTFLSAARRGKYLLLNTQKGTLVMHLGMSGSLRILPCDIPAEKHDHVEIALHNRLCVRFRDPRRFGSIFWTSNDPLQHKRLKDLGPEPLGENFHGEYLFTASRKRKIAVKQFIMNSRMVVGVGNIYANEALFLAGIRPAVAAGRISKSRYIKLASAIKTVLAQAIEQGGTTLRDFTASDGNPGYFQQQLNVYDRCEQPCPKCGAAIKCLRQGQRATYYCPGCQK